MPSKELNERLTRRDALRRLAFLPIKCYREAQLSNSAPFARLSDFQKALLRYYCPRRSVDNMLYYAAII